MDPQRLSDLVEGKEDWLNIQEVIRDTFHQFHDLVVSQKSKISNLEDEARQAKAKKLETESLIKEMNRMMEMQSDRISCLEEEMKKQNQSVQSELQLLREKKMERIGWEEVVAGRRDRANGDLKDRIDCLEDKITEIARNKIEIGSLDEIIGEKVNNEDIQQVVALQITPAIESVESQTDKIVAEILLKLENKADKGWVTSELRKKIEPTEIEDVIKGVSLDSDRTSSMLEKKMRSFEQKIQNIVANKPDIESINDALNERDEAIRDLWSSITTMEHDQVESEEITVVKRKVRDVTENIHEVLTHIESLNGRLSAVEMFTEARSEADSTIMSLSKTTATLSSNLARLEKRVNQDNELIQDDIRQWRENDGSQQIEAIHLIEDSASAAKKAAARAEIAIQTVERLGGEVRDTLDQFESSNDRFRQFMTSEYGKRQDQISEKLERTRDEITELCDEIDVLKSVPREGRQSDPEPLTSETMKYLASQYDTLKHANEELLKLFYNDVHRAIEKGIQEVREEGLACHDRSETALNKVSIMNDQITALRLLLEKEPIQAQEPYRKTTTNTEPIKEPFEKNLFDGYFAEMPSPSPTRTQRLEREMIDPASPLPSLGPLPKLPPHSGKRHNPLMDDPLDMPEHDTYRAESPGWGI